MVYFRKRLTPEILGEINELIIQKAKGQREEDHPDDNDDPGKPQPPQNSGTMIVDATCAPSNIKYPQDTELLNEARENTEGMIDELHDSKEGRRPRTYRKVAHKNYLKFARSRKRTGKQIRKSVRQQLGYLKHNLGVIDCFLASGKALSGKSEKRLKTIRTLYEQQKTMYDNKNHSVKDRIVSLSQPYLRPIVRGKAKAPVEFCPKLDISVANGFVRLEKQSFDPYNEAICLQEEIERYKFREGRYPERVLADKIYRNRENLRYCAERGIRLSGPALGRPGKDAAADKKLEYADICDRVEVERRFRLAKRKCGLGLIMTKLQITTEHVVAMSVLLLNLRRVLYDFLRFILNWISLPPAMENRPLFS
jgi:IS5 family transposase